ncbi:MAG: RIO-like serine/threonine protein kinase fused to N-terminal HTH domain [Candidatus Methanohalarchaeum thermophilum]|uniref:non-specific serine/threonine protein kinase n=1 Tax=Methanohalarchaeum thermophilum TaxID=1903181 RepID=A0A1Q6DXI1_METT1|nr:MAG: RIO-like serine/threonine protein kinase fused to N-terminal HTH domain [Candidatus Methanohalarchaeum thermophilum]
MINEVVENFRSLESREFRVLRAIERGMRDYDFPPVSFIANIANLPEDETRYRISRLNKFELVERKKIGEDRFRLNFNGYDSLALKKLVDSDTIDSIGGEAGRGKESDVQLAKKNDQEVIIKFHREGKVNFRKIKKMRDYLEDREHYSWMFVSNLAAKNEYKTLKNIYKKLDVPIPFDWDRHAIVMEKVPGNELIKTKLTKKDADFVFDYLIEEVKKAYSLGYIHADLSEYNVMVSEERISLIDWPQSVTLDHPNHESLLKRDITNLCNYFNRKYKLEKEPKHYIKKIKDIN